ncbi:MAG TPA: efflux RND transporter permease subunit [Bacteroidales bacterium]|nr:efflux RND transporter permease subunit [Bacteroidales bacterium]
MRKIVQFAVQFPVTMTMIVTGVLLLGYISLTKLNIELFPEINSPRIFVELKSGERPPEEIEKQFVDGMESMVMALKGVSQVSSVCMVGSARVTVEFNWGTDMDEAFLDIQKALTQYSQNSDIQDFRITQHDPNASPVMLVAVYNPEVKDMNELRKVGENYIRNELIRLEGVADVKLTGIEEKEIVVETDPYRLNAYGLTADNLVQQITSMNRNVSGGSIVEMGKRYIIKGSALISNERDIESLVVGFKQSASSGNGSTAAAPSKQTSNVNRVPIFLKEIANVAFVNKKPANIVRVNGVRCMGLAIYKETSYNTVKAVDQMNTSLEKIKKSLPGYHFAEIQNEGQFIQSSISELKSSALIGAIISMIVLFIFLRHIGVTLIISLTIPVSIIATFNLMYFNGLSLNIMTMGGLALGVGMLMDNAVVVMENIFRNRELGFSVKDSAIKGTSEVGGAIISSTLTSIVVFLPIVYLHGASGALFKDQAWTVTYSLLASIVVTILFTPMLYHSFYKNRPIKITNSLHFEWYGRLISTIIDKRRLVVTVAFLLIAATAFIVPFLGSEFIPKSGSNEFSIEIKLKEGTMLQRTDGYVKNVESILHDILGDKAEVIYSQSGPDESSVSEKSVFQNENTAVIKVSLKKEALNQSESLIEQISSELSAIPEIEINITRDETSLQSTLGTDEPPITVEVKGKNMEVLDQLTTEIKQKLAVLPEIYNLKTSIEAGAPEIDVRIDQFKASMYNLTPDNIAGQLKDLLVGKNAGKFDNAGELNDIVVRLPELTLSQFNAIMLKSGTTDVPLYEVAKIEQSNAPKQLLRRNQNRIGTVTADIQGTLAYDKVIAKVQKELQTITVPAEYQINVTGEELKRSDAMSSLGFALVLSIILVYMVMASQFESLIHPFTVLLTIPFAVAGTLWAFFLLHMPLNIMAYIGIIMLGGIAVNNSILLVDAINQLKREGLTLKDAVVKAAQNRIRPILITSLTTILGMVPLTLGFGEGAALRSPMAIAVITGLTTSTIMSLVVIPCVYYIFDRKKPVTTKIAEA